MPTYLSSFLPNTTCLSFNKKLQDIRQEKAHVEETKRTSEREPEMTKILGFSDTEI